ncbi:MAG: ATP-dependent helicase pcrA, partial [Bacteroidota bacterium]
LQRSSGGFQRPGSAKTPGKTGDQPTKASSLIPPKKPLMASVPPADPNFVEGDLTGLKVGDRVQHQRFGIGLVSAMEGDAISGKATVNFEQVGEKTLVLKFAKMRIL